MWPFEKKKQRQRVALHGEISSWAEAETLKSLKPLLLLIYMKCLIDTLSSNLKNALGETSA